VEVLLFIEEDHFFKHLGLGRGVVDVLEGLELLLGLQGVRGPSPIRVRSILQRNHILRWDDDVLRHRIANAAPDRYDLTRHRLVHSCLPRYQVRHTPQGSCRLCPIHAVILRIARMLNFERFILGLSIFIIRILCLVEERRDLSRTMGVSLFHP